MVAVGRGGGEQCMRLPPPGRAPPRLLPREPPLLRGNPGKGPVWFSLPGRGFPPRAPPRAISPRSGVRDGAGGGRNRGRHLRAGLSGDIATTAPAHGGGGGAPKARAGWGIGEQCMKCRRIVFKIISSCCAPSGLSPREPPLLRGSLMGGPAWFSLPGREFPPRPLPRRYPHGPAHEMVRGEGGIGAGIPGRPFRGVSRLLPPPLGRGRSAEGAGGVGDRRAVHGPASPVTPFPPPHHENPAPARGALGKGPHGSPQRGGGALPGPLPRRLPPRSGAWDDAGKRGHARAISPERRSRHNPGRITIYSAGCTFP